VRDVPDTTGRPLRIGLNLVFMGARAGGVGRYASELPGALLSAEPETELHVFVSSDAPPSLYEEPWAGSVRWAKVPVGIGDPLLPLLAQFAALPVLARARRLDVLHSPANTGPVLTPGLASVVSLHDLIWLHRPDEWEPSRRVQLQMRALVRHCVRHADRLFAGTRTAAEDLVDTLGVERARIEVTPHGVRVPGGARSLSLDALRARLQLGSSRIVLCVAQKRPYKNLQALVHALEGLDDDVVLVLPGAPTAHERELRELARELGVEARVRFPSWVTEEELDGLYALAEVFVLPSLIEGFGIPVIEAMARGVPVACANVSALPEVAGDAALLFDPQRQEQVTAAIRRILDDRALAAALAVSGRERAAEFTWLRTGQASLAGYRRAIAARATHPGAVSVPGALS
jgi:glycosyltransferase involved in cell wall biosynthesis